MKRISIATAVLAVATLAACGTSVDSAAPVADETTVATTDAPEQQPTEEQVEPVAEDQSEAPAAETFIMPNLVGVNLQEAQDELQSLGSYILSQDDATGQGRFQVLDSNWKVCSQDQAAGETFDVAELVNLTAVKLDESCP